MSSRIGAFLAAALVTGGLTGLVCGAYLVLFNPVEGFRDRFLLVVAMILIYAALLAVPLAAALLAGRSLLALFGRWRGEARFGQLVVLGIALAAAAVFLRNLLELAGALRLQAPRAMVGPVFGMSAAAIAVALAIWGRAPLRRAASASNAIAILAFALATYLVPAVGLALAPSLRPFSRPLARLPEAPTAVDELAVRPPSRRVALIGFDGLDPDVLEALWSVGEMPNFAALRDRGVYARLATLDLGLSPPIWTTLATGVDPNRHRIYDFLSRRLVLTRIDLAAIDHLPRGLGTASLLRLLVRTPFVREGLVEPSDRESPALWTLTSLAEIDTCVVDWMASWPSEGVRGTLISDRAFFSSNLGELFIAAGPDSESLPLRLQSGADGEGEATPRGLCSPEPGCLELLPPASGERIDPGDTIRFHVAENDYYLRAAANLLARGGCGFFAFYSHLPDLLNHRIEPAELENVLRGRFPTAAEQTFLEVYRAVDRTLGELIAGLGDDTCILVASDHGVAIRETGRRRYVTHDYPAPRGVFLFRPSVRAGGDFPAVEASIYDLAPTVLALLGLPVTAEMQGAVLADLVAAELGDRPAVRILRADLPTMLAAPEVAGTEEMEEDLRERLRSLGYIE